MKLLVSVRNEVEAAKALSGGCDILDIKEPSHGSLGRPSTETTEQIIRLTDSNVPVSTALGEFTELFSQGSSPDISSSLNYLKAGTAGLQLLHDWQSQIRSLNLGPRWVPVIYADGADVAAPDPKQLFDLACELGAAGILIDTCNKQGGRLLQRMSIDELTDWRQRTREAGMFLALAGSLHLDDLETIAEIGPDIVALRGAVCRAGDRTGEVDESLVNLWKGRLKEYTPQTAAGLGAR